MTITPLLPGTKGTGMSQGDDRGAIAGQASRAPCGAASSRPRGRLAHPRQRMCRMAKAIVPRSALFFIIHRLTTPHGVGLARYSPTCARYQFSLCSRRRRLDRSHHCFWDLVVRSSGRPLVSANHAVAAEFGGEGGGVVSAGQRLLTYAVEACPVDQRPQEVSTAHLQGAREGATRRLVCSSQ